MNLNEFSRTDRLVQALPRMNSINEEFNPDGREKASTDRGIVKNKKQPLRAGAWEAITKRQTQRSVRFYCRAGGKREFRNIPAWLRHNCFSTGCSPRTGCYSFSTMSIQKTAPRIRMRMGLSGGTESEMLTM